MSEQPRSDSTQDADEGDDRTVPTTVTSDGEQGRRRHAER